MPTPRDVGIFGAKLQLGLAKTSINRGEIEIYFGTKIRKYNSDKIKVMWLPFSGQFSTKKNQDYVQKYSTKLSFRI